MKVYQRQPVVKTTAAWGAVRLAPTITVVVSTLLLERAFKEEKEGLGVGGARASSHLGSPLVTCNQRNHSDQLPPLVA